MAETCELTVRTVAGTVATGVVDAAYARAIESLWRTAADAPSRAAILRGLRPPLEAARSADPVAVSLVVDGVEIG